MTCRTLPVLICTVLLIAAIAAAGCSSASPPPAAPATAAPPAGSGAAVAMKNFAFSPATITVQPGTTVTWTNEDSAPHTVVSADGAPVAFHSDPLATGGTFQFTFTTPGTYPYHCSIHPSMTGTIVVQG